MFETKLKIKGKGNLLDFIRDHNPELTGRYVRLQGDDTDIGYKAKRFMEETYTPHGFILRSDALFEDAFGASFAGLCNSYPVDCKTFDQVKERISLPHDLATQNQNQVKNIQSTLSLWKKRGVQYQVRRLDGFHEAKEISTILQESENIRVYAQFREVDISESRMDFILHERFPSKDEILISEHPNIQGGIHYEMRPIKGCHGMTSNDVNIETLGTSHTHSDDVRFLIQQFWDITRKLDNKDVYVAEVTNHPNRIVQIRPYFLTQKNEDHGNERSFGIINGKLEFELKQKPDVKKSAFDYNPKNYYPGLVFFGGEPSSKCLPADVVRQEPVDLVVSRNPSNVYLSHAGLKMLEATNVFSSEGQIVETLKQTWGRKKIRYFQNNHGFGSLNGVS